MNGRRVICAYFPMWSIDLSRRRMLRAGALTPGDHAWKRPVLLVTRVGGKELVAAACERSLAAGVKIGMDLSNAKALLPGEVVTGPHRPERDATALHALACWMNRYAPIVAADPPDGLLMDVSGTEKAVSRGKGVSSASLPRR
jgi:protein ImuB